MSDKPIPIYPIPEEGNLYKISYRYLESTSEFSLEKTTNEQLRHVTSNKSSVKFHQEDDFTPEEPLFTPEEIAHVEQLRASYGKYCEQQYKWQWKDGLVMSFDEWVRAMADNLKNNREGK